MPVSICVRDLLPRESVSISLSIVLNVRTACYQVPVFFHANCLDDQTSFTFMHHLPEGDRWMSLELAVSSSVVMYCVLLFQREKLLLFQRKTTAPVS